MTWTLLLFASYLLGSIPFSLLLVKALRGVDVRRVGSGNPGATNVLRSSGPVAALTALALDVGKGMAPVLAARALGAPAAVAAAAGAAAVFGHVFPVYLRFRGGKGVATALGALGALAPEAVLAGLTLFVLVVAWTRYVSLGSLVLVSSIPLFMLLLGRWGEASRVEAATLATAVLIAVLVVFRHSGNIRRLLAGDEHRIGDSVEAG